VGGGVVAIGKAAKAFPALAITAFCHAAGAPLSSGSWNKSAAGGVTFLPFI
jgi:hypothetical protein